MSQVAKVVDRDSFAEFLTDNREAVQYNHKVFKKEKTGKLIKIKADNELVYEIHKEKNILIVLKALYMTFHRDEYWGVAKMAGLEEVLADSGTLIRI
ncbi:MAG: hypothetical protein ACRCW2_10345 [Cellulosilyticaceae bacterium]